MAVLAVLASPPTTAAQTPVTSPILLQPARVYDGEAMHEGWAVLVRGREIVAAGSPAGLTVPADAERIALPGLTLLPGLVEGHSHLLLHPYNETTWNDQVLREPLAYRVARAVVSARDTLMAGITTVRDLGTEGAGYADVGLKRSIDDGIVPGPRMLVSGPAMVATGSYGPKGFAPEITVPQGAEEADGIEGVTRVARNQIGHGIDFVKIYADYRWGPNGEARPTFSVEEIAAIVAVARSSGRYVAAHASTAEGMRRAVMGGVETIDHGDAGTPEVWALMKEKGITYCPTLAAGDATAQYAGWKKGQDPEPQRLRDKRGTFQAALKAGVKLCFGGDVGVFAARRQPARTGDDGRRRRDAGRGDAHRHLGQRGGVPRGQSGRPREGRADGRPHRRRGRSDRRSRGAAPGAAGDEGRPDLQAPRTGRAMTLSARPCP